ncbi:MAG: NAD(+) diphosphatase [Sciscionella sp.]
MTEVGRVFELDELPALSRSTVDRHESLRDDRARQERMWPDAKVLVVDKRSAVLTRAGGAELVLHPVTEFGDVPPDDAVLLGEDGDTAYWAVRTESTSDEPRADAAAWRIWERIREGGDEQWLDLRAIGALLSGKEAGLLATAVGLLYWHAHSRFCANCGSPTVPVRAGWQRDCTGCGRQEYPRTDPAVIVLVHDGGDHVLLARQPVWPAGRYSVLAGFVEVGESMEATVLREVSEEVGVEVRSVRYLGSQPWPFPRSLMIGFVSVADRDQPLHPAHGEIEQARWVHRDQVRAAIDSGGVTDGLGLPGETSIARRMLESWARS